MRAHTHYVAYSYILYKWQSRGHHKMNIPRMVKHTNTAYIRLVSSATLRQPAGFPRVGKRPEFRMGKIPIETKKSYLKRREKRKEKKNPTKSKAHLKGSC